MLKKYNFVCISGPNGIITAHDMEEWPDGEYVKTANYLTLQSALREALDGWAQWYVNYPDTIDQKRIAALRKEFLE